MIEQIVDYIENILIDADYMCCGCKYNNLALSHIGRKFTFYIYDGRAINAGYPIFCIGGDEKVRYIRDLSEWMMLAIIKDWGGFKKELDFSIKTTLKERTRNLNNQLSHIGYVNEQLSKWKV